MPILSGHHPSAVPVTQSSIAIERGCLQQTGWGVLRQTSPSDMAVNGYLSKDIEEELDYPKAGQPSCHQLQLSAPQLPNTQPGAFQAASHTHSPPSQDSSPYSQVICSQTLCCKPQHLSQTSTTSWGLGKVLGNHHILLPTTKGAGNSCLQCHPTRNKGEQSSHTTHKV